MRRRSILGCLALGGWLATAAAAEPVTVYANIAQPPKAWLDDGTPRGFAVEAAIDVLRRAGYRPAASLMPFARAMHMTMQGNVMTGVFRSRDREGFFLFSAPLMFEDVVMVVAKDRELRIAHVGDLAGLRVGTQAGASYGDAFAASMPRMIIESTAMASGRLKMLAAGRIDVALLNPGIAAFHHGVAEAGLSPDLFRVIDTPLARMANHLIVARDRPGAADMIRRIDAAIIDARSDGTLDAIVKRYRQ